MAKKRPHVRRREEGGASPPAPLVKPPAKPAKPDTKPTEPMPARTAKLGSWGNASIDQWDQAFIAAAAAVERKRGGRVRPHVMKAMMDVETGGDGDYPADRCRPSDGYDTVPACGPMQIKRRYHFHRCPECDFSTVLGQIELATHIIGMTMLERGRDEYDALVTTYFPGGDVNGTTQKQYVDRVRKLVGIMDADLAGEQPKPEPKPSKQVTEADILNLITNHAPGVYISFPFRDVGNAIYSYGKGHGTASSSEHSGIDIWVPDETPVNAIFGGEVVCVGNAGRGLWGQGCGYFNDDNGGLGNITILTDRAVNIGGKKRPLKITYGHMSSATVRVGQIVKDGERIGRSGIGGGWPHIHLDTAVNAPDLNNPQIWNNAGEYHLTDPIPTIIGAMGGQALPVAYPDAYAVAQPDELSTFATVRVTADAVPVLQRAHREAVKVAPDIPKDDTFEAAQIQLGDDGHWYWIGRFLRGRVPVEGTESDDWPGEAA